MKALLKINTALIAIIVLCAYSYGAQKTEYYASVIKGWGILTKSAESSLKEPGYKGSVLLLSSELTKKTYSLEKLRLTYKDVIIVCDGNFRYDNVICDKDGVESQNQGNVIKISELSVYHTAKGASSVYMVPEYYFIYPKEAAKLGAYFNSLYKSRTEDLVDEEVDAATSTSPKNTLIMGMVLCIGFLLAWFISLIKGIVTGINSKNFLSRFCVFITHEKRTLQSLIFYMILIGIIIALVVLIVLLWNGDYIQTKLFKTLLKTFLLGYLTLIGSLIFLANIPGLEQSVAIIVRKINQKSVRVEKARKLLLFLLLSYSLVIPNVSEHYKLVLSLFFLMLIGFSALFFTYIKKDLSAVFKGAYLPLTLFISATVLILGTYFSKANNEFVAKKHETLFSEYRLAILPSVKHIKPNELFDPYIKEFTFRVFVNDFLVYDPIFTTIEHKPYKDLQNGVSLPYVIFLPEDNDVYVKYLMQNENIQNLFITKEVSKLFKADNNFSNQQSFIELEFDCSVSTSAQTISLRKYNLDQKKAIEVLNFPGCTSTSKDVYTIPMEIDKDAFYLIKDFENTHIKNIRIGNNSKLITNPLFFNSRYESNKYIESKENTVESTLHIYNINILDNVVIIRNDTKIDLANEINKLIETGYIGNTVTIWSDYYNAVINNIL